MKLKTYRIYKDGVEFSKMELPDNDATDFFLDELCMNKLWQLFGYGSRFTYN